MAEVIRCVFNGCFFSFLRFQLFLCRRKREQNTNILQLAQQASTVAKPEPPNPKHSHTPVLPTALLHLPYFHARRVAKSASCLFITAPAAGTFPHPPEYRPLALRLLVGFIIQIITFARLGRRISSAGPSESPRFHRRFL